MHELVFPTINFTILVVLLSYFLRKPVKKSILHRYHVIKTLVEEAQAQKKEAQQKYHEYDQKLKSLTAEAEQIFDRTHQEAKVLHEKILLRAQTASERILKEAHLTAEACFEEFKNQIKKEAIAQAIESAQQIIKERLSVEDQRRIVNEYVEKCGKEAERR